MLILSVSPMNLGKPYYFNSTRRKIYSLEELIYHCYYYWKQSIDDFLSGKIELWIAEELKLTYLATKIEKIKLKESTITTQYVAFLNIIDYFEIDEINKLSKEIYSWENIDQWRKYKEKGDFALENGHYIEAELFYIQSLEITDDLTVLNNLGVAYMKQEKYSDAMLYFEKAYNKEPNNESIMMNMLETLMLKGEYEKVKTHLRNFNFNSYKAYKMYGELEYIQHNYEQALYYFQKYIELENDLLTIIKLADTYTKLDRYKDAVNIIESIKDTENIEYYYKYAEINFKLGKLKNAIEQAKKAVEFDNKNIKSWLLLAQIYKKNKNISEAERALLKIFEIDPDNEQAKLEYANLKKSQGFIKDYQKILMGILNKWKQRYREEND